MLMRSLTMQSIKPTRRSREWRSAVQCFLMCIQSPPLPRWVYVHQRGEAESGGVPCNVSWCAYSHHHYQGECMYTDKEKQRVEECHAMFPDVHTVTTITKVSVCTPTRRSREWRNTIPCNVSWCAYSHHHYQGECMYTDKEKQRVEECRAMFPDVHTVNTITKVSVCTPTRRSREWRSAVQCFLMCILSTPLPRWVYVHQRGEAESGGVPCNVSWCAYSQHHYQGECMYTDKEKQRVEECHAMFPDVHTVNTITKVSVCTPTRRSREWRSAMQCFLMCIQSTPLPRWVYVHRQGEAESGGVPCNVSWCAYCHHHYQGECIRPKMWWRIIQIVLFWWHLAIAPHRHCIHCWVFIVNIIKTHFSCTIIMQIIVQK